MSPRKKKVRVCAQCGKVIIRQIKRAKKDAPLFCSVDCGINYHQYGEESPVKEKKKKKGIHKTKVVAVKDIKHTNPDWIVDPLFVYIGSNVMFQPMKKSIFHNPFSLKNHGRKGCMEKFKNYFSKKIQSDSSFKEEVEGLKGKILVCWCKPRSCHGDVIVNYLHKPKTLESYQMEEKEKEEVPKMDTTKTDLLFSLIRLYEVQQDQFTCQDRIEGVEGSMGRYIVPNYLVKQSGYPIELVRGCLLSLNTLENKIYWDGKMYIESKDHFVARNHTDYKGRVRINKYDQSKIYNLFGGQPKDFSTREIIRSR